MAEEEDAVTPDDAAAEPVEETPAEDEATRAAASSEATAPPQPEPVAPKERRRRARAAKAAAVPARKQMTPEERQAERDAERRRKADVRRRRRQREREKARGGRTASPAEPLAPRREQHPGQQKTRQGVVISDRASKTIVVRIDVSRRHPSYEKVVRTSSTLHAHDEREDAHIGDTVVVRESRPLSRTKRWRLVEVVERAR